LGRRAEDLRVLAAAFLGAIASAAVREAVDVYHRNPMDTFGWVSAICAGVLVVVLAWWVFLRSID